MGKVWYFSGYDGDKRGGGGRDKWVENEIEAQKRGIVVEGVDMSKSEEQAVGRKARRRLKEPILALDGQDFHMGGDRVTKIGEEVHRGGDVTVYWQNEKGGTYSQRWERTGERSHRAAERPKRIFTF